MSQRNLSDAQLGDYTQEANSGGGFSVRAFGKDAGREATDSYMVGGQVPSADFVGGASTADARTFIERHRDALSPAGKYFGGWGGGVSPPRTSLDVSTALPRTPFGEARARGISVRTNQEAYGELNETGDYINEVANPHYGGTAPTPAAKSWITEPIKGLVPPHRQRMRPMNVTRRTSG